MQGRVGDAAGVLIAEPSRLIKQRLGARITDRRQHAGAGQVRAKRLVQLCLLDNQELPERIGVLRQGTGSTPEIRDMAVGRPAPGLADVVEPVVELGCGLGGGAIT